MFSGNNTSNNDRPFATSSSSSLSQGSDPLLIEQQNAPTETSTADSSSLQEDINTTSMTTPLIINKITKIITLLLLKLTQSKTSTKMFLLLSSGIILGIITPQNPNLPTPAVQYTSSIIGYIYFLCWSVSFYPQIILNYQRRNTTGLSVDFSVLNVVGFGCYSVYVGFLFWSKTVRDQYQHRFHNHHDDGDKDAGEDAVAVQSNDVAFALHAFLLSLIQVGQIVYYQRKIRATTNENNSNISSSSSSSSSSSTMTRNLLHMIHPTTKYFLLSCIVTCIIYTILVLYNIHNIIFLDYLYMLSSIKLIITIIKYIPQVMLNYNRKSTVGWNVWNVLLDLSGGLLSLVQLLLDAWAMGDFTAITGNWVKFGLSFVSLFFDVSCYFCYYFVIFFNKCIWTEC